MDKVALGIRIQEAREKKRMTQEALAEAVNYSANHISVIERGQKLPRLDKLVQIANVLEVDADQLLNADLDISPKIESSLLFERIAGLPASRQRLVLRVLDALVSELERS